MQRNGDRMIADLLQVAGGHTHLTLFNVMTLRHQCCCDVGVRHGAEQLAVHAGLLHYLHGQSVQLRATSLGVSQLGCFSSFQFGATCGCIFPLESVARVQISK